MHELFETGDIAKVMLEELAEKLWAYMQNNLITKDEASMEIESLEKEIETLKRLESPLTQEERISYVPVEIAVRELKKTYENLS
ncbi:MAG: hypothetical protein HC836_16695 [Richelia sp. RM2_1_2]|nr:hypothetical protein [Richelia sp. RM2_1_2]